MKNTTLRRILSMAALAVAALSLTACKTLPPAAPAPVVTKTTVDLILEVRSKELDLERTDQMAWLKFAAESDSDMVKGFVMGRSATKGAGQGGGSSTTQTIMQAQAQADNTALRREEMQYANSWDRRLLPYVGLGLNFGQFSRNLSFQKWSIGENNAQSRYMFGTFRGTQQDAYTFSSSAFGQGSSATLGGINAGATAAATGAGAVASANANAAPTE